MKVNHDRARELAERWKHLEVWEGNLARAYLESVRLIGEQVKVRKRLEGRALDAESQYADLIERLREAVEPTSPKGYAVVGEVREIIANFDGPAEEQHEEVIPSRREPWPVEPPYSIPCEPDKEVDDE